MQSQVSLILPAGFSDSTNYSAVSGGWRAGCRLFEQRKLQFVFRDIFKQFIKDSLLI
jgi:hypothetical protein